MAKINYIINGKLVKIEVSEEFAASYAEYVKAEEQIERKEIRRHQSLEKSLDNGFDILDNGKNPEQSAIRKETEEEIHNALSQLTKNQRAILIAYAIGGFSFKEIGDKMGVHKNTVREYYIAAVKKMKKLLLCTLSNRENRGY